MSKTLIIPKIGVTKYKNSYQTLTYKRYERSDYADSLEVEEEGKRTKSLSFQTIEGANKWLELEKYNFEIEEDKNAKTN